MSNQETEHERFTRVLRELRTIAENPEEPAERRQKAAKAVRDLTRGSHNSPALNDVGTGNRRGGAAIASDMDYDGYGT